MREGLAYLQTNFFLPAVSQVVSAGEDGHSRLHAVEEDGSSLAVEQSADLLLYQGQVLVDLLGAAGKDQALLANLGHVNVGAELEERSASQALEAGLFVVELSAVRGLLIPLALPVCDLLAHKTKDVFPVLVLKEGLASGDVLEDGQFLLSFGVADVVDPVPVGLGLQVLHVVNVEGVRKRILRIHLSPAPFVAQRALQQRLHLVQIPVNCSAPRHYLDLGFYQVQQTLEVRLVNRLVELPRRQHSRHEAVQLGLVVVKVRVVALLKISHEPLKSLEIQTVKRLLPTGPPF